MGDFPAAFLPAEAGEVMAGFKLADADGSDRRENLIEMHFQLPTPYQVVLLAPEIPGNTGNIGRLCLATGSTLHLVKPLGFNLDDRSLKRAGLDYWADVNLCVWENWQAFVDGVGGSARLYYFSTHGQKAYWHETFKPGDYLVFGSETRGLPGSLLAAQESRVRTIPMADGRSLNLANSVGIVLYEAIRQAELSAASANPAGSSGLPDL